MVVLPAFFQPAAGAGDARAEELPSRPGRRLIYVGNLDPPKRIDTILRAMERVTENFPDAVLIIVGEGRQNDELARLAGELGVSASVHFLGRRPHERISGLLRQADAFVHCSDHEGQPVAIIEAMQAGLPIVAARVGGVADMVRDGETGFTTSPDDAAAFAAHIERLLTDDTLRRRLGAASARLAAERASQTGVIGTLERIYDEIMSASR
jgi:glycosyltransferase involved in cell wall biosynthesis